MTKDTKRWHPPDRIPVRYHSESPMRNRPLLTQKQKMTLAVIGMVICVGGIAFLSLAVILGW